MAEPLTAEDKREIDRQLDALKRADELIMRAKQAGIDVSTHEAEAKALTTKLTNIRRAFFPTGG